jgi:Ecdysteroid kinase-like family
MPTFDLLAVEDLTPERFTAVLAERWPGVVVESVRVIGTSRFGEGRASTADRVTFSLDYAPGYDAGLPPRLLLKTCLLEPHIPRTLYDNEVRFYRDIRHELTIETPQVFATAIDEPTGRFGVLMEDLTLRSARFPNATTPVTLEEVTNIVSTVAELHAQYWASPRFARDLRWLGTPCSGSLCETLKVVVPELLREQLKLDFKAEIIEPLHRTGEQLLGALRKVLEILDSAPSTLLHGDTHIGNTYMLNDAKGGLLDWQLMERGRWAQDLTYFLVTALDPGDRRTHERDLIAFYLDELRRRGVEPPSMNEAWQLHRQTVVWGLVVGWLITPPQHYGQDITAANLSRLVTAVQDLETFRLLP